VPSGRSSPLGPSSPSGVVPSPSTRPPTGTVASPNIWRHPATYELENRAFDRSGKVEAAMGDVLGDGGWAGLDVLDLGCGTGFHLPRFAVSACQVYGVEPHPGLVAVAARRTSRLRNVTVLRGTAQEVPVPPASVDVVHARWAYFFGPGCEPGLAELDRVVRRGGTAFVLDNDISRSTFGAWFRRGYPKVRADEVERFWSTRGWHRLPIDAEWSFASRAELESVVRIEFDPTVADEVLAGHDGTEVDYAINLWWRRF
jgi:SAM-dependent methyltransferase